MVYVQRTNEALSGRSASTRFARSAPLPPHRNPIAPGGSEAAPPAEPPSQNMRAEDHDSRHPCSRLGGLGGAGRPLPPTPRESRAGGAEPSERSESRRSDAQGHASTRHVNQYRAPTFERDAGSPVTQSRAPTFARDAGSPVTQSRALEPPAGSHVPQSRALEPPAGTCVARHHASPASHVSNRVLKLPSNTRSPMRVTTPPMRDGSLLRSMTTRLPVIVSSCVWSRR